MNRVVFYIVLGIALFPGKISAQFSRYWAESFSTKSALLSGAVVGGYQDESSIYYNPSILSDSSVNKFAFANGLATIDYTRYENALGDNEEISNLASSVEAGFISLNLYPKDKYQLVWKVAFFNKAKYDNGYDGEVKKTYNVFETIDGDEQYVGRVSTRTEFNDYWYGLGIAKFLNDKLSIGLSSFVRYTSLRYNYQKVIQVGGINPDSANQIVAINSNRTETKGYNWRGTLKLGLNYRFDEKLHVGLTVTSPSFSILGSASGKANISKINIPDVQSGTFLPDYFYDASAEKMDMKFRDPLSIALGVDYQLEKLRWNVTLEWFDAMDPYKLIDQSTTNVDIIETNIVLEEDREVLSYAAGGRSIINVAVGLEIYNEDDRSVLVGFKTDFDALNNYNYGNLADLNTLVNAKSNYYHFSAGKSFLFLNYDVLFGVQYSISRQRNLTALANFTTNSEKQNYDVYDLEGPLQNNMNFKGDAITVFVGLTLKN